MLPTDPRWTGARGVALAVLSIRRRRGRVVRARNPFPPPNIDRISRHTRVEWYFIVLHPAHHLGKPTPTTTTVLPHGTYQLPTTTPRSRRASRSHHLRRCHTYYNINRVVFTSSSGVRITDCSCVRLDARPCRHGSRVLRSSL